MGSTRAHGFPLELSGEASQAFPLAFEAILRRADEHFDQVVVQAIVKLTLKAPFELGVVQVARMQVEVVSMHWDGWILKLDDQLNAIALGTRAEIKQGVLVKAQLSQDPFQTWIATFSHDGIVTGIEKNFR